MAAPSPLQTFQLDRSHFNQTLYKGLRDLWFSATPDEQAVPTFETLQTWFGMGKSQEEKDGFDEKCRKLAGGALESIGPSKLLLPPFKSYEDEIEHAETLSAAFLREVKEAQQQDEKYGADTLTSLILLLDQMPRNLFRKHEELWLVYKHYDRLALALTRSSLSMSPRPMEHPSKLLRKYWCWFQLPLTHTEHLPTHELALELDERWRKMSQEPTDGFAGEFARQNRESHQEHLEPLRKFGRYPHRNECLGRETTAEEEEYLKTANTFGVKQKNKAEVKDEL